MIDPQDNPVEARRQAVQAELDARRPAAERNRLGQFATPNALAVEIACYVQSLANGSLPAFHFADPSVGTGSFYSAALTVFGKRRIEPRRRRRTRPGLLRRRPRPVGRSRS